MKRLDIDFLKNYDDTKYEKPSVTADICIFTIQERETDNYRKLSDKQLKLLLIKRGKSPYVGEYALPGGFVRRNETVDEAARRELREETGVECDCLEQVHVFSDPKRDPRRWVITTAYLALLDASELNLVAGDDASEAEWFEVSMAEKEGNWILNLIGQDTTIKVEIGISKKKFSQTEPELNMISSENIAFDHGLIIAHALFCLKRWIKETNIAFSLLPETFSLSQLKQVYEAILGTELYAAAFRRKMLPLLEETDQMTEDAGHRPSRLYKVREVE